jgi:hypothetical protein
MSTVGSVRWFVVAMLVAGALVPARGQAQVPGRFYWKSLAGANGVPLVVNSLSGNTNPFDPAHEVSAGADIHATLALMGYAKTLPLFGRAAMVAVLVPMGQISGEVSVGSTYLEPASGFGDPMLEVDINILGPRAQKGIPDALRYSPGFSVDLLADLAVPVGEYDSSQSLNIGQNRWYGRVGMPIVWQLGPWVPGRRTTLEALPAVWLFGANDDYVGQTLETDPLFQVDAHLTRDLTEHCWAALDAAWYYGGAASVDGVAGDKLNNLGVGVTLGYGLSENLNFTFGYKSTVNDSAPDDLRMSGFMVSLVYGWHPIIEGTRRLQSEK